MKIKIDENLPIEACEVLRRQGHDAVTAIEQDLGGHADSEVAAVVLKERRLLITLDLDFSDVRSYPPEEYPGIIVLRLKRQDRNHVLDIMERLVAQMTSENPEGHLWIVEEHQIRIRP